MVELEADTREEKVEEGDSEVNARSEGNGVVAESVAGVVGTTESVADVVDSAGTETGSADEMAVGVADSDDKVVVVPASVMVAPVEASGVDTSLKAMAIVDPVSPSIKSVWELPVLVCTSMVAPLPSTTWTTEMVWTTSVMVEPRGSRAASSSRRLWYSAWERTWRLLKGLRSCKWE